jgi:hypothetical protein
MRLDPSALQSLRDMINSYNTNVGGYNDYVSQQKGRYGVSGGSSFWNLPDINSKANELGQQYNSIGQALGSLTGGGKIQSDNILSLKNQGVNLPQIQNYTYGDINKGIRGVPGFLMKTLPAVIGSIVAPPIGAAYASTLPAVTLGAIGAGIGSGVGNLSAGNTIKDSLISGGLTGAGSYLGGKYLDMGTVGSAIGQTPANAAGDTYNSIAGNVFGTKAGMSVGNAIKDFAATGVGGAITNASVGSIVGGKVGSSIADSLTANNAMPEDQPLGYPGPEPFTPKREDAKDAPPSISGLGQLTGDQQATNLANQGVYGSGLGKDEQSYFLNMENRKLVDDGGKVASNADNLSPIERSYLQQGFGVGDFSNTSNILEAISKWRMAQA